MALRIYRRHLSTCKYFALPNQQAQRRCKCPIYIKGTLQKVPVRRSLDLTDWDAANKVMGEWTGAGKINGMTVGSKTVAAAVMGYLDDMKTCELASGTIRANTLWLEDRLLAFCTTHDISLLGNITTDHLSAFRAGWTVALSTKCVAQTKVISFFNFCQVKKWIIDNPAHGLTKLAPPEPDVQPFEPTEITRMIDACDALPVQPNNPYDRRARARAMVLLLSWTGLRISDVATLKWSEVKGGRLHRVAIKNGATIRMRLSQPLIEALFLPDGTHRRFSHNDTYVFWSGFSSVESMVTSAAVFLEPVYELAKVTGAHAHRFRHTFVVEAFKSKVTLSSIAKAIGDQPNTVEKYYKTWVDALQEIMEEELSQMPGFSTSTRPQLLLPVALPPAASAECDSPSPL